MELENLNWEVKALSIRVYGQASGYVLVPIEDLVRVWIVARQALSLIDVLEETRSGFWSIGPSEQSIKAVARVRQLLVDVGLTVEDGEGEHARPID